jgi:hypothetical protein
MVLVSPGNRSSGRKTADGYDIPVKRVLTWVVLGKSQLQQTLDLAEEGGPTTVERCTAFSVVQPYAQPTATGCELVPATSSTVK